MDASAKGGWSTSTKREEFVQNVMGKRRFELAFRSPIYSDRVLRLCCHGDRVKLSNILTTKTPNKEVDPAESCKDDQKLFSAEPAAPHEAADLAAEGDCKSFPG
jgi:hypothetical protein